MAARRLGEDLLAVGAIEPRHLDRALLWQADHGGRLGTLLLELGYVGEPALLEVLGRRLSVEPIALGEAWIDPAAVELLDPGTARQTHAVPVALGDHGTLVVAMTDPDHLYAVDDLEAATGLRIAPRVATDPAVEAWLDRLYPGALEDGAA